MLDDLTTEANKSNVFATMSLSLSASRTFPVVNRWSNNRALTRGNALNIITNCVNYTAEFVAHSDRRLFPRDGMFLLRDEDWS